MEPEKETTDPGNAVSDALANATEEQEITLLTELFGEDCRLGKKHRKTKQSDEEEDLEVDDANASQENEADISNDELEYLSWKRSYYIDKFKVPNPSRLGVIVDFLSVSLEPLSAKSGQVCIQIN